MIFCFVQNKQFFIFYVNDHCFPSQSLLIHFDNSVGLHGHFNYVLDIVPKAPLLPIAGRMYAF